MIIDKKANSKEVEDKEVFDGIDLQLFTSKDNGEGNEPDDTQDTPPENNGGDDNKNVEFTEEQQEKVNQIIQERLGREKEKTQDAINKALKKAKADWEKDKDFQKSLAEMNDDDKAAALQQKQLDDLKAKENELRQRELLIDTNEMLVEKEIPKEFASILIGKDEETTKENVEVFYKLTKDFIDKKVSEGVQKTLSTRTPGGSGGVAGEEKGAEGKRLAKLGGETPKDNPYF